MVHEILDISCAFPYHATRLRPMPVLEMCGRTRDYEPPCDTTHTVWHWWEDISLQHHFSSSMLFV